MATRQEDEWSEPYLRTDLPDEDYDRLVAGLRSDPKLLRKLLEQTSQEDESLSASLLFGETGVADQEALDERIRSYLLRDPMLTQEDIAQLEESLIEDERYLERMLLIENELIEDYLRGALSAEEAQRFNTHFLITPERQEKLRYLRALALAAPVAPPEKVGRTAPAPAASSWWQSLLAFVRPPNLLTGAVAATVLLLMSVGVVLWLTRQASRQEPLLAEGPAEQTTQNTSLPSPGGQNNSSPAAGTNSTPSPSPATPSKPVM